MWSGEINPNIVDWAVLDSRRQWLLVCAVQRWFLAFLLSTLIMLKFLCPDESFMIFSSSDLAGVWLFSFKHVLDVCRGHLTGLWHWYIGSTVENQKWLIVFLWVKEACEAALLWSSCYTSLYPVLCTWWLCFLSCARFHECRLNFTAALILINCDAELVKV